MSTHQSVCPYCGNHDPALFREPIPVVDEKSAAILRSLGLQVPLIEMCKVCSCTLSPKHFHVDTPEYQQAYAARH